VISRKLLLALTMAVTLVGCGGGDDSTSAVAPETVSAAMQAQAQAPLPERQSAASAADAATQMLDFAEGRFPQYFPTHTANSVLGPLVFRYYPQTEIYLGVGVGSGGGVVAGNVYVMGGLFGARPIDVGPLTNFITPIDSGVVTNKTLLITGTVSFPGQSVAIPETRIEDVPQPASQAEFCGDLMTNDTYAQIFEQYEGTLTLKSCSFSGNTGSISAEITSPSLPFPVSFVANYTFE
jgi:hypothetical protein